MLVLVIMSLALMLTVVLCLNWRRRRQLKALLEVGLENSSVNHELTTLVTCENGDSR